MNPVINPAMKGCNGFFVNEKTQKSRLQRSHFADTRNVPVVCVLDDHTV